MTDQTFTYWAFISYSHQDKRVARWLKKELESQPVPSQLRGGVVSRQATLRPIFLDEASAAAGHRLTDELQEALRSSRKLIILCSPFSRLSTYVNQEIAYFKALGRGEDILCLVTSGLPNATEEGKPELEAFPDAIRFEVAEDGTITDKVIPLPERPLAASLGTEMAHEQRQAADQIASGILDISQDTLKSARRRRSARRITGSVAAAAVVAAAAIYLWANWFRLVPADTEWARGKTGADFVSEEYARLFGVSGVPQFMALMGSQQVLSKEDLESDSVSPVRKKYAQGWPYPKARPAQTELWRAIENSGQAWEFQIDALTNGDEKLVRYCRQLEPEIGDLRFPALENARDVIETCQRVSAMNNESIGYTFIIIKNNSDEAIRDVELTFTSSFDASRLPRDVEGPAENPLYAKDPAVSGDAFEREVQQRVEVLVQEVRDEARSTSLESLEEGIRTRLISKYGDAEAARKSVASLPEATRYLPEIPAKGEIIALTNVYWKAADGFPATYLLGLYQYQRLRFKVRGVTFTKDVRQPYGRKGLKIDIPGGWYYQ